VNATLTRPPPLRLLVEQRFPLKMTTTLPAIRALYNSGKAGRWNPHRSIDWAALAPERYDGAVQTAARLAWSRRTWMEATGLTETPALLVRMCMETGREIEAKNFLTVRNTEEAWHIECFDRLAEAFGGRITRPSTPAYEALFNRNLHRRALDSTQLLDGFIAVYAAFEDGLELQLCRAHRAGCNNPAVAAVLDHVIADKERHASFGWLYLESRAPLWTDVEREQIATELQRHIQGVELKGYHCPWLAPEHAAAEAEADAVIAAAGLGGADRETEEAVFATYVGDARVRLGAWGVALPWFETNRMRAF
jgi:hypothetical protein